MNIKKVYKEATLDIVDFLEYLKNKGVLNDQDKIYAIVFPNGNRKIKIFYKTEKIKVLQEITKRVDFILVKTTKKEKLIFLNLEVYELNLSNRVRDRLKDNFNTAKEITESSEGYLRKIRGIGAGAIYEIKVMLAENGFRLSE